MNRITIHCKGKSLPDGGVWEHGIVRLAGLLVLDAIVLADNSSGPQQEDLRAVKALLKKKDASLDWFRVLRKKPVDAGHAILLVEAAPTEARPGFPNPPPLFQKAQVGVFVVEGETNQVQLVIDTFPLNGLDAVPLLEQTDAHSVYLHFYGDYGFYRGSVKYVYDLGRRTVALRSRYGILALTGSAREGNKLSYQANFASAGKGWSPRYASITIEPRGGDALPMFRIADRPPESDSPPASTSLDLSNGETAVIATATPPGHVHQPSAIHILTKSGMKHTYPAPIPTMALHRKILADKQAPIEIQSDIGPFALQGSKIWFASTFYDGEGVSGVGAVGSFDVRTRKYEMRYLPEIAPWSGSAILLDGDDLWIGLMRRPEGANYGAGLLRYQTKTGAIEKYAIPDLIHTIDRLGDTLYLGTSHGLYTIRGQKITQLRFEPTEKDKLALVAREIR